jgi:hypothetical protein
VPITTESGEATTIHHAEDIVRSSAAKCKPRGPQSPNTNNEHEKGFNYEKPRWRVINLAYRTLSLNPACKMGIASTLQPMASWVSQALGHQSRALSL